MSEFHIRLDVDKNTLQSECESRGYKSITQYLSALVSIGRINLQGVTDSLIQDVLNDPIIKSFFVYLGYNRVLMCLRGTNQDTLFYTLFHTYIDHKGLFYPYNEVDTKNRLSLALVNYGYYLQNKV